MGHAKDFFMSAQDNDNRRMMRAEQGERHDRRVRVREHGDRFSAPPLVPLAQAVKMPAPGPLGRGCLLADQKPKSFTSTLARDLFAFGAEALKAKSP